MPQKLTNEKLDELINDEYMAHQEYLRLGFKSLARDELRHYNFLKRIKERRNRGN